MSKVLVTGADGFIGSHLVEALVAEGYDVRAMVLYNSFGSWGWLDQLGKEILSRAEIFTGDVRDTGSVRQAVKDCDTVFHLAALIAIPYSYRNPESYVDTNIKGTLNVVQAAREFGTARVIHTSTSEVYGSAIQVPISESHPLQGQSPYSASKIGADQIALSYHHSFQVPVVVIRPFNTYGPRQSARAIVPTIIGQILNGSRALQLGALWPTRDFSYVKDIVRAFLATAAGPAEHLEGRVINIGSGSEIAIGDLAELIANCMNTRVELKTDPARLRPEHSEVKQLLCDNRLALKLLGWKPQYGTLDGMRRGLKETIDWFSEPGNRRYYKNEIYNI